MLGSFSRASRSSSSNQCSRAGGSRRCHEISYGLLSPIESYFRIALNQPGTRKIESPPMRISNACSHQGDGPAGNLLRAVGCFGRIDDVADGFQVDEALPLEAHTLLGR